MKTKNFLSIAFGAGIVLFDILFWHEQPGLNFFIFSGFLAGVLMTIYPEKIKFIPVKVTLVGTLFTGAMIVINNSTLSIIVHLFSILSFIGFVHHEQLRFAGSALASNFLRCIELPIHFLENLSGFSSVFNGAPRVIRILKLTVFPVLGIFLFFQIYISANSKFAELSRDFFSCFDWISIKWLTSFSFGHVMFILFGSLIVAWALIPSKLRLFEAWESRQADTMVRKKSVFKGWFCDSKSMIGLKNEFRSALMLIGSLNVLLFLVNMVDIRYVWFGSRDVGPGLLSQYVHEGTWLLIFSIILAMGILFFFFRGNLNFLRGNTWLKRMSFIWIAQNAMLACSVAARNYQYIAHHGLAYKRIGVGIFLILTLFGLATMVVKVNEKKSLFYLLRVNGWALFFVLVSCCAVNWDVMITKYNLTVETKSGIDVGFLINDISDKNLYILDRYYEKLTAADPEAFEKIHAKRERFESHREGTTWVSWNWPDWKNREYFSNN